MGVFSGAFSNETETKTTNTDRKLTADAGSQVFNLSDFKAGKKASVGFTIESLADDVAFRAFDTADRVSQNAIALASQSNQQLGGLAEVTANLGKDFTEGLKDVVDISKSNNAEAVTAFKWALIAAGLLSVVWIFRPRKAA